MSSTVPAVLPISNSTTTAASGGAVAGSEAPASNPALRALINNLSDSLRHGLSQRRPWSELADRTAFSKPESFSEATLRVRKNFSYFRINYYAIVSVILAVSLLTNPFSLILLLGLLTSWTFLYLFRPSDQPLVLLGRTFSDFETLALLSALTVFVVFLTSVGSVLVSALMLGVAVVCLHGAFRVPEDLFLDEQDNSQATGFLSFLRTPAVAVASAAMPTVTTRV
ncbi:PRA1 family protein B4-like [Gastrolobium bilobum]|uniref:PRA1 family protein B4-like n=1 Tax=Gastrolobium bilobum TaxID=150636 RepID=UPI002AB13F76|nr:PRA1 family protein B4-like [Gastrolobium bilobum]